MPIMVIYHLHQSIIIKHGIEISYRIAAAVIGMKGQSARDPPHIYWLTGPSGNEVKCRLDALSQIVLASNIPSGLL